MQVAGSAKIYVKNKFGVESANQPIITMTFAYVLRVIYFMASPVQVLHPGMFWC